MNKLSAVDRAFFKGFADRIMKSFEEDDDNELVGALGLLNQARTAPAKDERPPRAGYARGEMARTALVDNVLQKSAV